MKTIIISIGDELLTGGFIDTNGPYIADQLAQRGCTIIKHICIGDDQIKIASALTNASPNADLIIVTGGLGPTGDDITRFALADALGEKLITDDDAVEYLHARYSKRGMPMPQRNMVQTLRPESASMIENPVGTACGLDANINDCRIVILPGVPREMKTMWQQFVLPSLDLNPQTIGGYIALRTLKCVSLAESRIGEILSDLMERDQNPLVATLPHDSTVTCRVRAVSTISQQDADDIADATIREINTRLAPYVFTDSEDTDLAAAVNSLLTQRNKRVTTAESCTGGLVGKLLTDASGASASFLGGWQTYSNMFKINFLGVDAGTLDKHGAVSGLIADQMALGAINASGADYAIAVTGIAGPDGGTETKPVGTVFIALSVLEEDGNPTTLVKHFLFPGNRERVRTRSAYAAIAMLYFFITQDGQIPDLLWELNIGSDMTDQ